MKFPILIFSIILATFSLPVYCQESEERKWRDSTGAKSFIGAYMGFTDGKVTIATAQKEYTIPLEKLHEDDQKWIRENKNAEIDKRLADRGVFDTLRFGDSYRIVLQKLKKSNIVVSHVGNGIFDGLTGIDGKFRTKNKLGDLQCFLYFDWQNGKTTDMGSVKSLSGLELRSDPVNSAEVPITLKQSWNELIELFEILHGPPSYAATRYPSVGEINQMGGIVGTHKWNLPSAKIVLGPAINPKDKSYFLYVVISDKP